MIVAIVFALFVIILVARSVRIIPQAHAGVVERLGRYTRTLDPGLHVLVPFVEKLKPLVDMREQVVTFPPQPVITQDNVTISIDTVFYFHVTDPFRATYEVADLILAVEQLTVTTLRNVIGSLSLEEVLTSRDKINADLRIVLDEATERWGIRVARIELKSIDPPASIQEAMEKQMRAERDKRAAILSAEGEKQSAILTAEGQRQSVILRAEADQKSQILRAEGDKQAAILRATGEAEAIRQLFQSIHDGDPTPDLLAYKYLEALPKLAEGQSTKLMLIPSDAMQALGGIAAMGGAFQLAQDVAGTPATTAVGNPRRRRAAAPRRLDGDGESAPVTAGAIGATGPRAEGVRWDLSRIVEDAAPRARCSTRPSRPATRSPSATAAARRPRRARAGRRAGGASAISNALGRVGSYAGLRRAVDVNDDEARDLEAVVEQGMVRASQRAALLRTRVDRAGRRRRRRLADAPEVARDRHHLRSMRRYRPHRLPSPRSGCSPSAARRPSSAWQNLFEQTVANVRAPFDDGDGERDHTVDELLAYVHDPARGCGWAPWRRCTRALEPRTPMLAHCYDSLVADRLVLDRLRGYPDPMAARHLDNELDPAAVEAMMPRSRAATASPSGGSAARPACSGSTGWRWRTSTRRSAGAAPCRTRRRAAWSTTAFTRFAARGRRHGGGVLRRAPRRRRAAARQARRRVLRLRGPGLRAVHAAELHRPLRDVMTMAHELGHGMHFVYSSRRQTALSGARAARPVRGAVDVRRARGLRPHAGDARAIPRRAPRSCAASWSPGSRRSSARR